MGWFEKHKEPEWKPTPFVEAVAVSLGHRCDDWVAEEIEDDDDRLVHTPSGITIVIEYGVCPQFFFPHVRISDEESRYIMGAIKGWIARKLDTNRKEPNACNSRPTVRLEDQFCDCRGEGCCGGG